MFKNPRIPILLFAALAAMIGCHDDASHVAREAADRQAQQNTTMAELNREVAGGANRLVEADSQARRDMLGVHHDLQTERARLDSGWSELESERQRLARERRTESFLVAVTPLVGFALTVILAIGLCWWMLVSATSDERVDARLNDVLVAQILPDEPMLVLSDTDQPQQELLDKP